MNPDRIKKLDFKPRNGPIIEEVSVVRRAIQPMCGGYETKIPRDTHVVGFFRLMF